MLGFLQVMDPLRTRSKNLVKLCGGIHFGDSGGGVGEWFGWKIRHAVHVRTAAIATRLRKLFSKEVRSSPKRRAL